MARCSMFTPDAIRERRAEVREAFRVLAKYDAVLMFLADAIEDKRLATIDRDDGSVELHLVIN